MTQNISVAVVGCGYWGKNLVRTFHELGVLKVISDANPDIVKQMAAQYGVSATSFDAILKDDAIDAVALATPAAQHASQVEKALSAGKHVFVEKPLALNISDAAALCDLAKTQNRKLMVGHLLQYHPAFLELKKLVAKGELGKIISIASSRLNLGKFRNEENILWSFAPHDISMILGLMGHLPQEVFATGISHLHKDVEDVTITHLKFKGGAQAHVYVSWLHPYKEQKLTVVGDKKMAVFDDGQPWGNKLQIFSHQIDWLDGFPNPIKAEATSAPVQVAEPLKVECQHFIDSIVNNEEPKTNGEEGLGVLRVLDAAQRSLKSNNKVLLSEEFVLPTTDYYVHDTSFVDPGCVIGKKTKIWHYSHILKGSVIGEHCVIGQNVMIGPDVTIGNRCKIQNNVSLYNGIVLEDGVFCGPSCVFTNVMNPRAEVERKDEFRNTYVERGVTIGANATIVCGVRLGAYSFIGAGAVVIKDVKPHAVMVGNPARQIGWMSHAGEKLDNQMICPREGRKYIVINDQLKEIEQDETSAKIA